MKPRLPRTRPVLRVKVLHLRVAELESQLRATEQTLAEVLNERYPLKGDLR